MTHKKRGVVVGLTGNIASGKTTILKLFSKLGCKTFSTDIIAHDLLRFDPNVKEAVVAVFGPEILDEHGHIKREPLANIVFQDPKMRKELEKILHPEIKKAAEHEFENLRPGFILIMEVPLLFEAGWDKAFDYHVAVTCPSHIRRKRYYSTGHKKEGDFERRDKAQWSEEKKAGLATFTIDNSTSLPTTILQVKNILKTLRSAVTRK